MLRVHCNMMGESEHVKISKEQPWDLASNGELSHPLKPMVKLPMTVDSGCAPLVRLVLQMSQPRCSRKIPVFLEASLGGRLATMSQNSSDDHTIQPSVVAS
jgi:hypothetical protein